MNYSILSNILLNDYVFIDFDDTERKLLASDCCTV
jgi:hypothetical protein